MAKYYVLNADKVAETKFGEQASLIVKALEDKQPDTVKGVSDRIKDQLKTRQTPERVVNFYLSTWRKRGIVSYAEGPEETPVSNENSSTEESTGDIAQTEVKPPSFDILGCTIKEAVLHMIDKLQPTDALSVTQELQVVGRTLTPKQTAEAVKKLVKDGHVVKNDDGTLTVPQE